MATRLKPKQVGPWCQFCADKKVRATHRNRGFMDYACERHEYKLDLIDKGEERMTEADWQTWSKV